MDCINKARHHSNAEERTGFVCYALHLAQTGKKHSQAKSSSGFGGAGVLEVVEPHQGRHTEARNRPYQSAPG
jgi:phage-related protein